MMIQSELSKKPFYIKNQKVLNYKRKSRIIANLVKIIVILNHLVSWNSRVMKKKRGQIQLRELELLS
jgi:hypothetical protein